MTQKPVHCPQCDAPFALATGQRHCRCPYCGSRFVVDWSDPEALDFTNFEAVLNAAANGHVFQAADQRLAELEVAIADAEDEVESRRELVRRAEAAYGQTILEAQHAITLPQARTLVVGLAAALVWFLVVFVLENVAWYVGLVVGVGLVLLAADSHRVWQRTEEQGRRRMRDARQTIELAQAGLVESQAHLEDRALECELCQRQVAESTLPPATRASPGELSQPA